MKKNIKFEKYKMAAIELKGKVKEIYENVVEKNPGQSEFHQAVKEVLASIEPALKAHHEFEKAKIVERLVEPERAVMFRVPWVNDKGEVQINRGYRIEFNSAIGPYKGGLRFHPTVNLSILKFLGFEQILKNALTTLPMGGGKGGSDFDPKGKSDNEVMKFCQSFISELYRHIGADTDVPAGDIGVGGREIGYMFGQYKRLTNKFESVFTGKGIEYGGSMVRPEATGYGLLYFVREMLKLKKEAVKGKVVAISGSGNVSQYAAQKTIQMGGKVVTLSDSNGTIYDAEGVDEKKLAYVMELKNIKRGRIKEYAEKFGCEYCPNEKPWKFKCDIALPSATQNEISKDDAKKLINNGVIAVGEGANMPSTIEAIDMFLANNVLFGPAKAANAGGVATSGLEMCQNHIGLSWTFEEVDAKLDGIMRSIFNQSTTAAEKYAKDKTNLVVGANIAGFMKVGNAMLAQGVV